MPKKRKRVQEAQAVAEDEERYFLNPESVSCHLYCSICQEVFVQPQRAPCGHSYCKKCILAWLNNSKTCPEDRKSLKQSDLHHDFILENIIGDQMVACPHRPSGCTHIDRLDRLANHKGSCHFNPANLPEFLLDSPEAKPTSLEQETEDDPLPAPGIPSLKMRLFCADAGNRKLLYSMFDSRGAPAADDNSK